MTNRLGLGNLGLEPGNLDLELGIPDPGMDSLEVETDPVVDLDSTGWTL